MNVQRLHPLGYKGTAFENLAAGLDLAIPHFRRTHELDPDLSLPPSIWPARSQPVCQKKAAAFAAAQRTSTKNVLIYCCWLAVTDAAFLTAAALACSALASQTRSQPSRRAVSMFTVPSSL